MAEPLRIVSLLASATEILYALGLGEQVVAVSHECDFPADVLEKPRVTFSHVNAAAGSRAIDVEVRSLLDSGSALYEIDVPAIAALRPDLIVTQAQCDVCSVRHEDVLAAVASHPALRAARVLALAPNSLADVFADIARVGEAACCSTNAARVVNNLKRRKENIARAVQDIPLDRRPRVACIEWIEPLMLAGNWMPELVELAGGRNLLARGGEHSAYADWKELAALDPQVLVIMPCGFNLERAIVESAALETLEGWPRLAAVRAGNVFAIDGSAYFNRSGPRMVDSLEILAHLLHPERVGPPPGVAAASAWRRLA